MPRESSIAPSLVIAGLGVLGWVGVAVLTVVQPPELRGLELTGGLVACALMAAVARLLAVHVFGRVLIALDSAFYVSAAFVWGVVPAGWLLLVVLTGDALVRYARVTGRLAPAAAGPLAAAEYLVTNGGVPALGLVALGLLFRIDQNWPMSDWQLTVVEPLFAVTFLIVHYSVAGSPQLLGESKARLWRDFFVRVVLAELFLVPLALAMVIGYEYQGLGLYLLLGVSCLTFNVIFRRGAISQNKLHERIEELSVLDQVGRVISGSLERRTLLSNLAVETVRLVRSDSRFMIGLCEAQSAVATYELFDEHGRSYRRLTAPREEGLSGWVMLHREPLLLGDLEREYHRYSRTDAYYDPAFRSWLGVPLIIYDDVIGVICVQTTVADAYTVDHQRVLVTIADQAAVALENSRLYELATVDGLTGLLVRRHFEHRLEEEWARSGRYGTDFAVGILDLDDFKSLNDTFGHPAGDQALRAAAAIVRGTMRGHDLAGRYGGEEFSILLPRTGLPEAAVLAERIRADIERMRLDVGGGQIRLTASIGLVAFPDARAQRAADLVALADEAMYVAKRLGKNRVCTSDDRAPRAAPEATPARGAV